MNRRVSAILFVSYVLIGFSGFLKYLPYQYLEMHSWDRVMSDHVLLLVFCALAAGVVLFFLNRNIFPAQYEKRKNKVWYKLLVPMILFALSFSLNLGLLYVSDSFFPNKKDILVRGTVIDKNRQRSGIKNTGQSYSLDIRNNEQLTEYRIQVKKNVYENISAGSTFSKWFHVSYLGIIYLKEE